MKRTKADLINELATMTKEKDILIDMLEGTHCTIGTMEDEIKELREKEETLDILIDLIDCYAIAHTRYTMGILTELETIEKLTDKLLDMRSIN